MIREGVQNVLSYNLNEFAAPKKNETFQQNGATRTYIAYDIVIM